MKRRTLATLPLAAALARALPAAAQQPAGERKVLRLAFRAAETSFDPVKLSDLYSRFVTAHIFESPYEYDPLARPAKVRPLTADGLPVASADFKTWTIKLRPGIYYADDPAFKGQRRELVAADYLYAYLRAFDPANRSPLVSEVLQYGILGLTELQAQIAKTGKMDYDVKVPGIELVDRHTLRFHLDSPRPRFNESALLTQSDLYGAVAREVVEHYGDDIGAHPVGTGPFRLKTWRRSAFFTLERSPFFREMYFDAEPAADDAEGLAALAQLKGRRIPMVDEVQVSIIEEDQPRWLSFLNTELDAVAGGPGLGVPPDFINIALPNGKIAPNLAKRGIRPASTLNADVRLTYFNMEDPVVGGYTPDKVALRRAISLAYDTERELRLVYRNRGILAQSPIVPNTTGYDPNFHSEMSEYNPAKAKALLDLFGYVDRDGDGWREMPDGSPLLLQMASQPDQFTRSVDEVMKKSMDAVGMRMVFVTGKFAENLKSARAGKLMMWQLGSSADIPDGQSALARLDGPQSGAQNLARFKLPAFDAVYAKLQEVPNGPERDALFLEAKKLAAAYMPYKNRIHRVETDMLHPWVVGYRRPVFWLGWWQYVDIDLARKAKPAG